MSDYISAISSGFSNACSSAGDSIGNAFANTDWSNFSKQMMEAVIQGCVQGVMRGCGVNDNGQVAAEIHKAFNPSMDPQQAQGLQNAANTLVESAAKHYQGQNVPEGAIAKDELTKLAVDSLNSSITAAGGQAISTADFEKAVREAMKAQSTTTASSATHESGFEKSASEPVKLADNTPQISANEAVRSGQMVAEATTASKMTGVYTA